MKVEKFSSFLLNIVETHGWLRFIPLSITHWGSCKHQLGRIIIIKDDLIGNSWGSMSIFVQSEKSFNALSSHFLKWQLWTTRCVNIVVMLLFYRTKQTNKNHFCRKHCLGQLTQNIERNWVIIITCMDRQEIVMNK